MIGSIPPIPEGNSRLAVWARWVQSTLFALQPMASPGAALTKTSRGWSLTPIAQSSSLSLSGRYRLKSVQGDYITCRSWNGTTEGTQDIYIAKDPQHRNSIVSATKPDGPHTYSYGAGLDGNNILRTNTNTTSGQSETEYVTPLWTVNDDIFAVAVSSTSVKDPNGNEITLLAISPSRQWASQ